MTEVTTWGQSLAVVARELTYDETADLDRLRAVLAAATDRTDPRAIARLWDWMLDAHRGRPAPAGFVESVATALGDLLAVHVPTARWAVWPGPGGDPTLGVASQARPHAPVVPFLDARDRWTAGARDWIGDYLARASAHLRGAPLPRPRRAPDDHPAAPLDAATPVTDVAYGADVTPQESHQPHESHVWRDETDEAAAPAAPGVPLQEFALDALDHAMTLLRETGAFDREVYVLLLDGSGRRTESCTGDARQARARASELVRLSGAARAAVTWVERDAAMLPGPRQGFPAVLVDAWDAGADGVRVGRRFVDDVLGTGPLGAPLVVGPVAALL